MTIVLLGLRFVLELALFTVIGILGFGLSATPLLGWALAAGLVLLTAVVWGLFLSPRRRIELPLPVRVSLELALFVVAALGLARSGHATWAWALIGSEVIVLVALWRRGLPPGADVAALPTSFDPDVGGRSAWPTRASAPKQRAGTERDAVRVAEKGARRDPSSHQP